MTKQIFSLMIICRSRFTVRIRVIPKSFEHVSESQENLIKLIHTHILSLGLEIYLYSLVLHIFIHSLTTAMFLENTNHGSSKVVAKTDVDNKVTYW